MLAPQVAALPVRFATGGSNVLDEVQTRGGAWITETWPFGTLPTPTVSGSTATYVEALPGIDIRLKATASGMSTVLVVKNATAASDPRLRAFRLSETGVALAPMTADRMLATTPDGATAAAGSPLWWDSTQGGTADGPGGNEPDRPVTHATDTSGLTLDIGQTIAHTDVKYPIYVDPDWSSGIAASWYTDAAYPDQSYLDPANSDVLRVGAYAQWNSYMIFEFPISALAGKKVVNASLATTQLSIDACPTNPISIEVYGPQAAGFTWNQQSGPWNPAFASQNPGTCDNPGAAVPVGWDVGAALQSKIGESVVQFLLFGPTDYTRRHFDRAATLYVNYDTPPNTPTSPQFVTPTRLCSTSSSTPVKFNGNQTMTVQVSETDPDGGNVADDFYLQDVTTNTQVLKYTTPRQAGPVISWSYSTSSLTNGHEYSWRAQGSDYQFVSSGFSAPCYFTIDDTAPVAPVVSKAASAVTIGTGIPVTIGAA
ncbi:hypothetical protein, partial [Microbacterium panaciterrae]|uniref:hypothetical protein n=1 Tax=Microbacterium panaciterrae TaxID=985759 RepID=UPI0031E52E28